MRHQTLRAVVVLSCFLLSTVAAYAARPAQTAMLPATRVMPQATGSLTGQVVGTDGRPIPGILIGYYDGTTYLGLDVGTDSQGKYSISVPAGQYFVNAVDLNNVYVDTWFPNVWDTDFHRNLVPATPVKVPDGGTGVANFTIDKGAHVLLTLKDSTGAPVDAPNGRTPVSGLNQGCFGNMFVEFNGGRFRVNASCYGGRDFDNGTYDPYNVPIGRTVFIQAWPVGLNFKQVFYDQKTTLETATPIPLTGIGPVPITIVLGATGRSISGRYSFNQPPTQIIFASASVFSATGTLLITQDVATNGTYAVTGLDDGDYIVRLTLRATTAGGPRTYTKYYRNADVIEGATRVSVRGADVTGIDIVLDTPADVLGLKTQTTQISLIAPASGSSDVSPISIWTEIGQVSWTARGSSSWLRVSPPSGTAVANGGAQALSIFADASQLAPGNYTDTLTISGDSGVPLQIPVTLQVTAAASASDKPVQTGLSSLVFNAEGFQFQPIIAAFANPGTTRITWNLRSPLVQAYPESSTLEPGASIEVKIAAAVTGLEFGSVTGQAEILTNGRVTDAIPVTINANPVPIQLPRTASAVGIAADMSLTKVVPTVASNLPGAASSIWSSDVFLTNLPSKVLSNLTSFFFTPFGQSGGASLLVRGPIKFPMTLLSSPIATMFRQATGFGALDMRPEAAIATWSRVWTPGRDGRGTYGQEILAFDSESIIVAGEKGVIPVLLGGSYRSNLLLTETRGASASVRVDVRNSDGATIGDQSVDLDAYAQRSLSGLLPAGVTTAYAELTVTGSGAVGALASLVDNQTNDPTTIIASKNASRTASGRLIVPGVARGPGASNSVWRSDVWLVNSSSAPMTFVPLLYVSGATQPLSGKSYTVQGGSQVTLQDALVSDFNMQSGQGALLFDVRSGDASGIRMISRTFNLATSGGTLGQGVLAVRQTDETKMGEPGLALFGLQRNRNFRTNLQIQETSGALVSVEILATAIPASSLSSTRVSPIVKVDVQPYEFMQLRDILGLLGLTEDLLNPRLTLRVVSGSGSIMAYGSLIDSTTNDATTVPAFKLQP